MVREAEKQVAIAGRGGILKLAYASNALFSEIGIPWARACEPFSTEGDTKFPVRFQFEGKTENPVCA